MIEKITEISANILKNLKRQLYCSVFGGGYPKSLNEQEAIRLIQKFYYNKTPANEIIDNRKY